MSLPGSGFQLTMATGQGNTFAVTLIARRGSSQPKRGRSVGTRGPGPVLKPFPLKAAPDSVRDPALGLTFRQFSESSSFLQGCPGLEEVVVQSRAVSRLLEM